MKLSTERKRLVASVAVLGFLTAVSLIVWSVLQERAEAAKVEAEILKGLSEEELVAVLQSEADADLFSIRQISENAKRRKSFLDGLREHLSLAAQARREGFTENEDFRINLSYKTDILLGDLYRVRMSQGKGRLHVVPEAEMEAFWKVPGNEQRFSSTMSVLYKLRKKAADAKKDTIPVKPLAGDTLEKARDNFARTSILAAKAREDKEFMAQPAIPLRIKLVEAGLLANDYLIENYPSFVPTDSEIEAYLASHPEYDPKRKLNAATAVLAKAMSGEDFGELAEKYSEDARSSHRGGLYEDAAIGALWPEIEERVVKMKPGQIADELIETNMGYHVVQFVGKKEDDGGTKISVRHIVLQKKFEEPGDEIPGMPRPFMTPLEIAKQQVEKQKREAFVSQIMSISPVSLPDDFKLELSDPVTNGQQIKEERK